MARGLDRPRSRPFPSGGGAGAPASPARRLTRPEGPPPAAAPSTRWFSGTGGRGGTAAPAAWVLWAVIVGLAWLGAAPGVQAAPALTVLVYHHLEDPTTSDVSCTPAQFAAQMEALQRAGFTPLTLPQIRLFLAGGLPDLPNPVAITFDDGYESLYHHALPVARRLRLPMIVFLVTSRLGRQPQFTRYLSPAQIKEMAASGWFEFGSHTHDLHTDTMRIWDAFRSTPNPLLPAVTADFAQSQARLREILGHPAIALAWPYGKYNAQTRQAARHAGFQLHFTSRPGSNEPGSDPFGIKRLPVTARDTPESVVRKARGSLFW